MNEPNSALERQAASIEEDAVMTNLVEHWISRRSTVRITRIYSVSPLGLLFGGRDGRGRLRWRRAKALRLNIVGPDHDPLAGSVAASSAGGLGIILPMTKETPAATKDTTVACTCSRVKFPIMRARRTEGLSNSPTLAAVPSLAERFISRLPLRFSMTGMIIMSSSTRAIAFQCWGI